MTTVSFIVTEGQERVRLQFAFDARVNEIVKGVIPGPHRGFDRRTKTWWVRERFAQELAEHLMVEGHDVTGRLLPAPAPITPAAPGSMTIDEFFAQASGP